MAEMHGWQIELLGGPFLIGLLLVVPFWRSYRRAGLNPFYALLVFLPFFGILAAVAVLALSHWPLVEGEGKGRP